MLSHSVRGQEQSGHSLAEYSAQGLKRLQSVGWSMFPSGGSAKGGIHFQSLRLVGELISCGCRPEAHRLGRLPVLPCGSVHIPAASPRPARSGPQPSVKAGLPRVLSLWSISTSVCSGLDTCKTPFTLPWNKFQSDASSFLLLLWWESKSQALPSVESGDYTRV